MNEEQLVKCLAQLANITRLRIYKLLVKAGDKGLNVGDIKNTLEVPSSTLSHHLSKLINLELIFQERQGRVLKCKANFKLIDQIINELKDQCCSLY